MGAHSRNPLSLCANTSYSMMKSRTKVAPRGRRAPSSSGQDSVVPGWQGSRVAEAASTGEPEPRIALSHEEVAGLRLPSRTCAAHSPRQERAPSWWPRSSDPHHRWRIHLRHLILVLCSILMRSLHVSGCHPGIETAGWTSPSGDIIVEHGNPLKILCMLNQTFVDLKYPGKNASDLVFMRNRRPVEKEYVRIVNETAIEFYIEKPEPSEDMYYCKLRNDKPDNKSDKDGLVAVCLNNVYIGYKPLKPQNFDCVTINWQSLHCEWTPVKNYVMTKFNLSFYLSGLQGRSRYPCPNTEMLLENKCFWNTSTDPFYRQPYQTYHMILTAVNALGKKTFNYSYDNFANMIPASPFNLTATNKTSKSVGLVWTIPFPLENFPRGLVHKIMYQSQWDPLNSWKVIYKVQNKSDSKVYYNLTDLEYANAVYDVRVSMKSGTAKGDNRWGNYSVVTFRTLPKLPKSPPRTDIGSFEIVEKNNNRDVYLYWQAIPGKDENGENFHYKVTSIEESGRRVKSWPNETTKTYAKFKGLSFNYYRFEIASANIVGQTKQTAKLFVPSRYEQPAEPIAFTKIAFDRGVYELSWKPPPKTNKEIKNYTIFWCDNDRDRPYQCTGYFDWIHVPKNITMYNMTVPDERKVYQFAISANTDTASSGMVWASCTVIHNKVVGKMKSAWINRIGSDYIEVGWKLECSDRIGIVEGFKIYYCPIGDPYVQNCQKNTKQNVTIKADSQTIHGVVQGLKPYTTYKLSVSVLTKNGEGLHSDPLLNTTLEAAPSTPPRNVYVSNITNSSAVVSWEAPEAMNGVLRYYEVYYNSKSVKVEEATEVKLNGLSAHTNYSVRIVACTVSCSVKSTPVSVVTDIGTPGIMDIPSVHFVNSSQVEITWKAPEVVAGHLDYYQILNNNFEIYNSTGTETQLPIPDCQTVGREIIYRFQVRAVNVAQNNTHLYGPWSTAGEGNCYGGGPSENLVMGIWGICIIASFAFIAFIGLASKRLWMKCRAMRDVGVKLPPGLTPNMMLLQKGGDQHIRQSSTDSSGCSSGQGSVTSSLTSESHVSNDSGADVDPISTSNKLLESTPAWETSSLRLRNISGAKINSNADSHWDSYVKITKSGEVPLTDSVSLAKSTSNLQDGTTFVSSPQTWSSTGYMTMPSSEDGSNSSSPIPKEVSNLGAYSILGTTSKPERTKSDDIDFAKPPSIPENKESPSSYVSLAAASAKLSNRNFPSTISKTEANPRRSYVPNTFGDHQQHSSTPFTMGVQKKPFTPSYSSDVSSKPYVSITVIPDVVKNSAIPENATTLNKSAPPVYQMLRASTVPDKTDTVEDTRPLCWQSAGSEDSASSDTSSGIEDETPVVSSEKANTELQQFAQNLRYPTKTGNSQTDEQYSKVGTITNIVP